MGKRQPVSDAQLVAACLAWGRAWREYRAGRGACEATYVAQDALYALSNRVIREREPTKRRLKK